ncbi:MAG: sigma 54-interacting transcriptional regulator, partial [Polyangiaceae bacterium]
MSDVTSTMARKDDPRDVYFDAALVLVWAPTWASIPRGLPIIGKSHVIGREPAPGGYAVAHSATSRMHAVVHRDGERVRIKDAGSRNGTFVNGERITERELVHGDHVRMGDALFVFKDRLGSEHLSFALDGSTANGVSGMVGGWSAKRVALDIDAAARTDLSVVVHGETGVGKELCARALHAAFGRRGPFVAVNCAALSPTLFESELFGHEKGAFTGADRKHEGLARAANGGTLFLDEIGDLALDA